MGWLDWLVIGFASFIVVVGGRQVLRESRSGREFTIKGELIFGSAGRAGFQATIIPSLIGTFLLISGLVMLELKDSGPIYIVGLIAIWGFLLSLVLVGSLFLFMRPRFLVLPILRGQPGWVVAAYRSVRTRKGVRAGGKRSR